MDTSKEKIETIISQNTCIKNFKCYQSNFIDICKAQDMGQGEKLLECIDENGYECEFSVRYRSTRFCGCKVRAAIAQELGV
jgi:hypothetical protein